MRKTLYALCCAIFFISCSSDDDNTTTNPPETPEIKNEYVTGKDLSKNYFTYVNKEFIGKRFNALGYGYDITGKYAHPFYVRAEVIDAEKFETDYEHEIILVNRYIHGSDGIIYGSRDEMKQIMNSVLGFSEEELSTYKNVLNGLFDLPFENDDTFTDIDYYYAFNRYSSTWRVAFFRTDEISLTYNYLTKEFKTDIQAMTPVEIIEKYGTHVLTGIEFGKNADFIFRASSSSELDRRLVHYSAYYFSSTGGIMTSKPESYLDKENLYYEIIGGNPMTPNAWMVDITNGEGDKIGYKYADDIEESNLTLVNFYRYTDYYRAIIPIYEFVQDTDKRKALEEAYKAYLSN